MKAITTESEDAVVVAPEEGPADAAIIWMHGLGADGFDFVPLVPELKLPASARVRFVFPHADVRPVSVNAGYAMRAWYDIKELTPEGRDDAEGLDASRTRIEAYIARERVAGIPAQRILLAGFSQGGALALHVGLRHDESLAGILALSCYLPMRDRIAVDINTANRGTPILMCHGRDDVVVLPSFGEASRDAMFAAGLNVEWRLYYMAHNLCRPQIADIAVWIQKRLNIAP
jgi:phospholipase/carboxylesterase